MYKKTPLLCQVLALSRPNKNARQMRAVKAQLKSITYFISISCVYSWITQNAHFVFDFLTLKCNHWSGTSEVPKMLQIAHWTPSKLRLLGADLDTVIAKKLGLQQHHVKLKRKALGIPPFRNPKLRWTSAELKLLGTDLDSVIARKLGLTVIQVQHKRSLMGIRAYHKRNMRPWTKPELEWLGKDSDAVIAKKLERTQHDVLRKRQQLGIAAFGLPRKWTKAELALLGTCSDAKLAKRIGTTQAVVINQRVRLGIPSFRNYVQNQNVQPKRKDLKPIPGFPGYFAAKTGRIYSFRKHGVLTELIPYRMKKHAHLIVKVRTRNGRRRKMSVNRAVLLSWRGKPTPPNLVARHLDDNPYNNNLKNLRWGTYSETRLATTARGIGRGENHPFAKLTEQNVLDIRRMAGRFSDAYLARRFGVSRGYVPSIYGRKVWKHI